MYRLKSLKAMERNIFVVTVLCLVLSGVSALEVAVQKDVYEVARGDNVTLQCSFTPVKAKNREVIVTWSAEKNVAGADEDKIVTYYYSINQTDIAPNYEGRASLRVDVPKGADGSSGVTSLTLYSVTLKDNKIFQCDFLIPGDDAGTTKGDMRLLVLVAPSTPVCNINGKAEYFQDIQLTCKSDEGSPAPTYQWQRRDVNDAPLPHDPKTTDKDGILSLRNITKDTSGYYICTSSNKIRSATCKLTLSVMPPSMNLGSTPAIIGGIAGALVLIGIITCVVCYCRKKKRNKEEEYAMRAQEEDPNAKEPLKNGRQGDGEDDVRSDVDESSVRRPDRDGGNENNDTDDRGRVYDDRHSDYDTRRSDYSDRRSDYEDRSDRYSDRHERYDDGRRDDRRDDRRYNDDDRRYDDERPRYDDRRYDDERRRYDDERHDRRERHDDEHYDDRDEERDRDRPPSIPPNKPNKEDYDY